MKGKLISIVTLSVLLISMLISGNIPAKANPETLIVSKMGGTPYLTIQAAINHAKAGDTILVNDGTYYEHVVVNQSVLLTASRFLSATIDGNGTGNVVNVTASNVRIEGFIITRSSIGLARAGIHVELSNGVVIRRNRLTINRDGISLYSSSNNIVSSNDISSNGYGDGISLYSSSNNVVSDNLIVSNNNGISLSSSVNNVISRNLVSFNTNGGIGFSSSSNNVVSDNTVSSNLIYGITFSSSSDNSVFGNTISNNNIRGLIISLLSNNMIYHNNFDNLNPVSIDSSSTTMWDYGGEGNYWRRYNGTDSNKDGIGDSPFRIDQNNLDNYPLAGRFYNLNMTFNKQEYQVMFISNSTVSGLRFENKPETGNKLLHFNVTGTEATAGFCRVRIPIALMDYPLLVLVGGEEIASTLLAVSNQTYAYLYFSYNHSLKGVTVVSSGFLHLYNDLLNTYGLLQKDLDDLNSTYYGLLRDYNSLLSNHTKLLERLQALNSSYENYLMSYSESTQNLRNLTYIFAAATAILLITTIYVSKRVHATEATEIGAFEEKETT